MTFGRMTIGVAQNRNAMMAMTMRAPKKIVIASGLR